VVRTRKKAAEADAPEPRSLAFRIFKAALVAVATAAVGLGAIYGIERLRDETRQAPTYRMSSAGLRLVQGPPWMTPAILAELDVGLLDPDFPREFSLLDEGVSARIARAYERCVWVQRVERIVKHDPRVDPDRPPLEVFLKFRRPVAFVAQREGFCLIDERHVRLPGVYREPKVGALALMVVTGVQSRPPAVGEAWDDPAVQAGVRVAEAVAPKRETFRLVSVDVSNYAGRRDPGDTEIALMTTKQTRIKWGKAPSPEAALLQEKSPDEKVAYLDYVYRHLNGQVDGILSYIDIPNEAVRRRPADDGNRLRS
jgi:hypothetical protein